MAEMNAAFFEEAKYNLQHGKINFLNVAGLIPEVAEERHVVVRLPANSMHLNHVNIVYAGSYFVLAESWRHADQVHLCRQVCADHQEREH